MSFITLDFRYLINIGSLFFLAIIFSLVGEWLNVPLPWLLIPIFISVIWSLKLKNTCRIPNFLNTLGQAVIAVVTASRFSLDSFTQIQSYFFPLLICIFVTGTFSILNGYLISKWTKIDITTSLLGCIPGASASLVAMSEEIGADAIIVAILQCLRIILVSLVMPIIGSFYAYESETTIDLVIDNHNLSSSFSLPINLIILSIVTIVSIKIGQKVKLPSNNFLAPFFGSLIFLNIFPYQIVIPHYIFCLGLLLFGISLGVKFEKSTIQKLAKALILEIFLVLFLIAICLCAGYEFHLLTHIDTMTSLLGSTPGALNAMMATVIELGGNSSLVLTMQMTRMLLILVLTPFLVSLFLKDSSLN